ncbi:MAG: glycosyltransferase family 9 protein [Neisseriaceae bacterium]|nr:glycosyltransferase family 9 protein [Neisseriaceae bacterium]
MIKTLIPQEVLDSDAKILFIVHLAIGDFTYLQNFFLALTQQYPKLRVDLFIDETRRTEEAEKWPALQQYVLFDWIDTCSFFNKVYKHTYNNETLLKSIQAAQAERYSVVISLATIGHYHYAQLVQAIANGHSRTIATRAKTGLFQYKRRRIYRALDATIAPFQYTAEQDHISDQYAYLFGTLAGLKLTKKERYPFIQNIPEVWQTQADAFLAHHKVDRADPLVFINPFAKDPNRCWPITHALSLIANLSREPAWAKAKFVFNAMPQDVALIEPALAASQLDNVVIFSALNNFFELPVMIGQCDLVISVETSVMHLANAMKVPVIALMNQTTPEWYPIDQALSTVLVTQHAEEPISAIGVNTVTEAVLAHGLPQKTPR